MSLPVSLIALADDHTETFSFIEQIESISGFAQDVTGLSSGRTLLSEFRWSTDGVFSGSFIALTNAQLQALVLDADDRFHLQVKWTRTGTATAGIININQFVLNYATDPNAVFGHGSFTVEGMFEESKEFLQAILEQNLVQINGDSAYDVQEIFPKWCNNVNRPIVYFNSVDTSLITFASGHTFDYNVTARVGVQILKQNRTPEFSKQIGILQSLFHPRFFGFPVYSFTFKSVPFVTTLTDFGVFDCKTSAVLTTQDAKTRSIYQEFQVSFKVRFPNFLNERL